MQFQIASDLHFETRGGLRAPKKTYPTAHSRILVLAGDIYPGINPDFKEVIRRIAEPFYLVLFVPGNHEFYESSLSIEDRMREACNALPNVLYFNKASLRLGDTTFLGATMWTNVPKYLWDTSGNNVNDYRVIRKSSKSTATITPSDTVFLHKNHAGWLRHALRDAEREGSKNAVVITHHAPTMELSKNAVSRPPELFPYYYSTDLEDVTANPLIHTWVHGHTHESRITRFTPWGPIFACNAMGYPSETTGYSDNAVITAI